MVAGCSCCTLLQIKSTGVLFNARRGQNDFQPQNLLLEKFHYTLTPVQALVRTFIFWALLKNR
jgi:hypothetical protein